MDLKPLLCAQKIFHTQVRTTFHGLVEVVIFFNRKTTFSDLPAEIQTDIFSRVIQQSDTPKATFLKLSLVNKHCYQVIRNFTQYSERKLIHEFIQSTYEALYDIQNQTVAQRLFNERRNAYLKKPEYTWDPVISKKIKYLHLCAVWCLKSNKQNLIKKLFNKIDKLQNCYRNIEWKSRKINSLSEYPEIESSLMRSIHLDNKNQHGDTFLHIACDYNLGKFLKILLKYSTLSPNSQGEYGYTPLHTACFSEHTEIVEILLKLPEINPNIQDIERKTALHYICYMENKDILKILLKHPKTDPNIQGNYGNTPLHLACIEKYPEIVEILLNNPKTKPNIQDNYGNTPLHLACIEDYTEIIKILLNDPRINPKINNNSRKSPFSYTKSKISEDIFRAYTKAL